MYVCEPEVLLISSICPYGLTIHAATGTTLDIIKQRTMYASSSYGTYLFAV